MAWQRSGDCLAGCTALQIDETARTIRVGVRTSHAGELITFDGNDGVSCADAEPLEFKFSCYSSLSWKRSGNALEKS